MPLSTYSELQAAIGNFLNRDDLASAGADFIALAEADLRRDVRHHEMIKRTTIAVSSRYTSLPDDWLETIRVEVTKYGYPEPLQIVSWNEMVDARSETVGQSLPCLFAHVGSTFEVCPTPSESIDAELTYYGDFDSLSGSTTTNWLLAAAPDAYLYGSLVQSAPWLSEDERLPTWLNRYQQAVNSLNTSSKRARHSGSRLVMR